MSYQYVIIYYHKYMFWLTRCPVLLALCQTKLSLVNETHTYIYIYIYIYIYLHACILLWLNYIMRRMQHNVNFFSSRVQFIWIHCFPSLRLVVIQRLKSSLCPTIYPGLGREEVDWGFFLRHYRNLKHSPGFELFPHFLWQWPYHFYWCAYIYTHTHTHIYIFFLFIYFFFFEECIFRQQVINTGFIADDGTLCLLFLIVIFQVLLLLCQDPGGKEIVPFLLSKSFNHTFGHHQESCVWVNLSNGMF